MTSKLGPEVELVFDGLLSDAEGADVASLRTQVRGYLAEYKTLAAKNGLLPVDIAEALAAGLEELLDLHASLETEHQKLVVAAARYFVSQEDARPDAGSVLGLDDDVEVFNYVADCIGHPERKLDI